MKPLDLKEIESVFEAAFEKTYQEYEKNSPEVKAALESTFNPKFRDQYFFNNGIKHILIILREHQEKKDEENKNSN